jgi:hypothetical protein
LLEGDEEGCAEAVGDQDLLEGDKVGWAETLGNEDGELECPVDGSDEGPDEGALLKLKACWKGTKRAVPKM